MVPEDDAPATQKSLDTEMDNLTQYLKAGEVSNSVDFDHP